MALTPNQRGALYMAIAMAGFSCGDAASKLASFDAGIAQIVFVRGIFATALILAFVWRTAGLSSWRTALHPLVAVRTCGEVGATFLFFNALVHLPIATVSAVLQALPLGVTMGAALVFGERVGWRRWTAIAVGFAGVLIIIRPDAGGTNLYALYALACVACCVVRDLATSRIPREVPSAFVSLVTSVAVTVFAGVMLLAERSWVPMSGHLVVTLVAAAVFLVVGYQFIIKAVRAGDISAAAPFRYTALLWSILLGIFVFGDLPDGPMIAGSALIVASGIYALYRDRVVGRRTATRAAAAPEMQPDGL